MKNSLIYLLHNKQNIQEPQHIKPATKSMNFGKMIKHKAQVSGYESPPIKEALKISKRYSNIETINSPSLSTITFHHRTSLDQQDTSLKNKMVRFEDQDSEDPLSFISGRCSRKSQKKQSILKKATSVDKASVGSGTSDMGQIDMLNAKNSLKDKGAACSNDKYWSELKMLKYQNVKFFDKIFPPGGSSLCYSKDKIQEFKEVRWMRISDLFKGKKQVIYNKQSFAKCIFNAGPLGYGFNLAVACNALANSNRCLQRIFEDQRVLGLCIYSLRLNHDGIWKYVFIDDFVPVVKQNNQDVPAFMRVSQNDQCEVEIWPLLIQKALAKIYSSYESLFQDSVENLLYDLTGFTQEIVNLQNQDNQFRFCSAVTHSQTVSVLCDPYNKHSFGSQRYAIREDGVMTSTTYFSLDYRVKLMDLKRYMNIVFDVSDLKKQFRIAKLFRINDTFYSLGCVIKQNRNSISLRKFVVKERGLSCMLSLIQKDKKHYRNNGYDYVWARMMVAIKDGVNGYRWIAGKYQKSKVVFLNLNLEPGEYFVLITGDWKARVFQMTLNYQGNQEIQFQRQPIDRHPNILSEVCIDLAQRFGTFKQLNKNLCSYRLVDRNHGFLIQNINNQVNRYVVFHKQYHLRGNNYELIDKHKYLQDEQNSVEIKINPNSHFTFIAKMIDGFHPDLLDGFSFD